MSKEPDFLMGIVFLSMFAYLLLAIAVSVVNLL